MAAPQIPDLPIEYIELPTKPGAKISYSFVPAKGTKYAKEPLIVFLNGLGLPAAGWTPTVNILQELDSHPALLKYDRYGQGKTTDRDPTDATAPDPLHPHDTMSSIQDLDVLLKEITTKYHLSDEGQTIPLFLVCNSIGGALSRLYTQRFPNRVLAILFLDSVIANTDFQKPFPDPDAPDFKEKHTPLPEGVTEDNLRSSRAMYKRIFHPSNGWSGKGEALSRKNLPDLLPDAAAPALIGIGGEGPWITVAGHDPETMANEGLAGMGTAREVTLNYLSPHWHKYNQGLAKLTDPKKSRGPIKATGCGHFIQKQDPQFVADEIVRILKASSGET